MDELIRLNKRIAQTGRYSRHEADKLVGEGRVRFNGEIAVPGLKVPVSSGEIIVDGEVLGESDSSIYKFHKPRGVLSSYSDPNGKKNLSSFPELAKARLGYSGRLDYDSEGLMLLTADGDLIFKLQKSEFGVEKEYHINVDKDITDEWLRRLENGIKDKDEFFKPCKIIRTGAKKYTVILTEGKKRQVRRMFKAAGSTILTLLRVRIGSVKLDGLKAGELKLLSEKETEELKKCIRLK